MFIVEDGTGKPDANSYQTVEGHKAYCSDRGIAVPDDATIEKNLIKATDYLVATYRGAWLGDRTSATQSTDWPRSGFNLPLEFDGLTVPREVKEAASELAIIVETTPLMPNVTSRTKKRVKVGPIDIEYDGDGAIQPMFVAASLKLVPFLSSFSSAMVKLTRV